MDSFDAAVFTYALRDAFSMVDLYQSSWDRVVSTPDTLAHGDSQTDIYITDDEGGIGSTEPDPQWFLYQRSSWSFADRVTQRWPVDFPYLTEGCLLTCWYADDAAAAAAVKKVWHLLTRISVNKVSRLYPGEVGGFTFTGRYGTRFGHHALEWCTQSPRRVIGNRFRPLDDWSVPKSKWYQGLRNRVIADYGEDFADPALRGPLVYFTGPVPDADELDSG